MIKIINKNGNGQSTWSGGVTTELFIYPLNSKYSERNFKVRVSSALVKDKQSIFTHLDGVKRYLTPINTTFILNHDGVKVTIKEKEVDVFDGGCHTECIGSGQDLNLMLNGAKGEMNVIFKNQIYLKSKDACFALIYAYKNTKTLINGQQYNLNENCLLYIDDDDKDLEIINSEDVVVMEIVSIEK
ncbi:MAG: HutD family protein [Clostridia bacterium]